MADGKIWGSGVEPQVKEQQSGTDILINARSDISGIPVDEAVLIVPTSGSAVTFRASDSVLTGDIIADDNSTVSVTLDKNTRLTGAAY
ncbi:hypothetical protein QHJ03_004013 [Salmonella enterica]|uniref:hypothetical protein n=1 Tax=Salmonella enterica TaxID=28901 RepID=UPI00071D07EA|nr:hypothetical protein [Salmonella enterica]EBM9478486.1 hypothetical protein [Salmonella enterica subsp. enterica serovar Rubislaw]ECT6468421.1 hypothetical protein [Salmonella enterica subsp. enterica serovar Senegal]EAQ5803275.1 hypothetical protein [Salmonella enterica]EBO3245302.1 hypothetical protein [Salmonella enterica subsp. enterica serovar Rubislaw]EBT5148745.1 hypothetical protein [Salmonella enterica]